MINLSVPTCKNGCVFGSQGCLNALTQTHATNLNVWKPKQISETQETLFLPPSQKAETGFLSQLSELIHCLIFILYIDNIILQQQNFIFNPYNSHIPSSSSLSLQISTPLPEVQEGRLLVIQGEEVSGVDGHGNCTLGIRALLQPPLLLIPVG